MTPGSAVGIRPSVYRRLPEGEGLPSLAAGLRPRGLLSPLLEDKSGLIRLESRSDLNLHIPLSSHLAAASPESSGGDGRTLGSFHGSQNVLTPGFTQKTASRKQHQRESLKFLMKAPWEEGRGEA